MKQAQCCSSLVEAQLSSETPSFGRKPGRLVSHSCRKIRISKFLKNHDFPDFPMSGNANFWITDTESMLRVSVFFQLQIQIVDFPNYFCNVFVALGSRVKTQHS